MNVSFSRVLDVSDDQPQGLSKRSRIMLSEKLIESIIKPNHEVRPLMRKHENTFEIVIRNVSVQYAPNAY